MVSPKDCSTPLGGSESLNLLSMTPSTGRFQFELEKTAIDINDLLVNNWADAIPQNFLCQWHFAQDTETSDVNVRVGFCSGGCSNILEACEDGLELSRILSGVEVDGIFSAGMRVFFGCISSSPVIDFLLTYWDDFFSKHPTGTYIQYVFGISCVLVQAALDQSPYREQVVIVAVNCTSMPVHSRVLSLRSDGDFFGDPDALWLNRSPDALGTFALRFSDPTFYPTIQSCYTYDSSHGTTYEGEHPIASVLTQNANLLDLKRVYEPFTTDGAECDDLLVDILTGVNNGYTSTLEGKELCSEFFLGRISCFVASCIRLVDYITLYIQASKPKREETTQVSTTTIPTTENKSTSFTSVLSTVMTSHNATVAVTTNSSADSSETSLVATSLPTNTSLSTILTTIGSATTPNGTGETSSMVTTLATSMDSSSTSSTHILSSSSQNLTASLLSSSYYVTSVATNSTLVSATSSTIFLSGSAVSSPVALVSQSPKTRWVIGALSGYWLVFGISQSVLIYCECRRNPNLRYPAFILNSIGTLLTLVDFVYNVSLWGNPDGVLHLALGLYSMSGLIREAIYLGLPAIRQGLQRGAILVTNWRGISKSKPTATILRVNNSFRKTMKRARIFLELMFLLSLGISYFVGCLLKPTCGNYIAATSIHFIFVCSLVIILAIFLYPST